MSAPDPKLLCCPFCGGNGHVTRAVGETWVTCNSCQASSKGCSDHEAGISTWNRRASDTRQSAEIATLRAALTKEWVGDNWYCKSCGRHPTVHAADCLLASLDTPAPETK